MNIVQGVSEPLPLRPGATGPQVEFPEIIGCQSDTDLTELDLDALEPPGFECESGGDMLAEFLRRGRLVRATGSTIGGGDRPDCSCASWVPVSPAVCPSTLGPCGTGKRLTSRAEWEELWVTTDEHLALVSDGESLAVLATDRDAPLRWEPAPDTILGVEYHPDTALLGLPSPPNGVRVVIPARHEADATFEGSAKAWGNRCFAHLQADRLGAAEAACFAGLLEVGTHGTRGALTYTLGRIAEARGEPDHARAYYERSRGLRPHAATAARLRALGGS